MQQYAANGAYCFIFLPMAGEIYLAAWGLAAILILDDFAY
jgi:hypothetical protein